MEIFRFYLPPPTNADRNCYKTFCKCPNVQKPTVTFQFSVNGQQDVEAALRTLFRNELQ